MCLEFEFILRRMNIFHEVLATSSTPTKKQTNNKTMKTTHQTKVNQSSNFKL